MVAVMFRRREDGTIFPTGQWCATVMEAVGDAARDWEEPPAATETGAAEG